MVTDSPCSLEDPTGGSSKRVTGVMVIWVGSLEPIAKPSTDTEPARETLALAVAPLAASSRTDRVDASVIVIETSTLPPSAPAWLGSHVTWVGFAGGA